MSLILDHVNYVYGEDTALAVHALKDINLVIPDGQFIGLIGHTGSGKSTLVQHLNGPIPHGRALPERTPGRIPACLYTPELKNSTGNTAE